MTEQRTVQKMIVTAALAVALVAVSSLFTGAFAARPHFIGEPTCCVIATPGETQGDLVCSGSIAGLGNQSEVLANLTANVTANFRCTNPGGNIVEAQSKVRNAPGLAELLPVTNGRFDFVELDIDAPTATCPNGNWESTLLSITWSGVRVNFDSSSLPISGSFTLEDSCQ
jgi:hypothetical protein